MKLPLEVLYVARKEEKKEKEAHDINVMWSHSSGMLGVMEGVLLV